MAGTHMTTPLTLALERKAALHKATEEMNEALDRAEEALRELDMGVTASVPLLDGALDSEILHWYRDSTNGWCLHVTRADGTDPKRMRSASRRARILTAQALTRLWAELQEQARLNAAWADDATRAIDAFIVHLPKMLP